MKVGLLGLMFLILFTLKVAGVAQISWWVVALPLLVPMLLWVGIVVAGVVIYASSLVLIYIMEFFSKKK